MDHPEQQNRYDELAQKLLDGSISEAEKQEYLDWLNREEEPLNIPVDFASDRSALKHRMYHAVRSSLDNRVVAKRRHWYNYAAAAAILLVLSGVVIFYWGINKHAAPQAITQTTKPTTDVLPGHDGAVLTLANGKKLLLDSLGNGVIATQGNTHVKIKNGQLEYDVVEPGGELLYNTMSTPKGRQFQLLLPDGSKVWLNAASSITYPTAFIGNERNVQVTGEVYFEVTKNKEQPFIVDVAGKAAVQVLGTSFNINAYGDEPDIKTTLLEGKVKMSSMANGEWSMLKPGEQASLSRQSHLSHPIPVQTEEVMAWKNGRFEFNGNPIQSVMRQLSRWYDVEVVYEGTLPEADFVGAIARQKKLSQVLKMLELTNVIQFKIQKKNATGEAAQLIVMRK